MQYVFNGIGEGTLVDCAKPGVANITIQGRMAQPDTPVATSFQVTALGTKRYRRGGGWVPMVNKLLVAQSSYKMITRLGAGVWNYGIDFFIQLSKFLDMNFFKPFSFSFAMNVLNINSSLLLCKRQYSVMD